MKFINTIATAALVGAASAVQADLPYSTNIPIFGTSPPGWISGSNDLDITI